LNQKKQKNDNVHYQIKRKPSLDVWALLVTVKKGKAICFQQVFPGSICGVFACIAIYYYTSEFTYHSATN
jgi:hypothetical protein